mmetsp:Transcript_13420/g.38323  ORF Transcript_13420/g.38323 Transcript_13420/m.38323 type:complete len:293 (-) Transcript_13420:605-1483(-)
MVGDWLLGGGNFCPFGGGCEQRQNGVSGILCGLDGSFHQHESITPSLQSMRIHPDHKHGTLLTIQNKMEEIEIVVAACCCVETVRLDEGRHSSSKSVFFAGVHVCRFFQLTLQLITPYMYNTIVIPTLFSTAMSSAFPSAAPTLSLRPSAFPSISSGPSGLPSLSLGPSPVSSVSSFPSSGPTTPLRPSSFPSLEPTVSVEPSVFPSLDPTQSSLPSAAPSPAPSSMPSAAPSQYTFCFDVIGNSGKFKVSTRLSNVTVAIDSLTEVDANGAPGWHVRRVQALRPDLRKSGV